MSGFTESVVEEAALAWLEGLGYTILHGPEIAPGEPFADPYARMKPLIEEHGDARNIPRSGRPMIVEQYATRCKIESGIERSVN